MCNLQFLKVCNALSELTFTNTGSYLTNSYIEYRNIYFFLRNLRVKQKTNLWHNTKYTNIRWYTDFSKLVVYTILMSVSIYLFTTI